MKKGNMFCASSSICKNIDHSQTPTIDRHNPIIKQPRRSFTCSSADDYIAPYLPLHQITKIPSSSSSSSTKPRRSTSSSSSSSSSLFKLITSDVSLARKSFSCTTTPACDFIKTTTTTSNVSTRYLLGSEPGQDKVIIPAGETSEARRGSGLEQVVVLRVSLHCHCKGCESKVKKHLSRMQGVTSFNIDFASKKVTVTGDITPLQVLGCLSKVKNAQFSTPIPPSSNPKP